MSTVELEEQQEKIRRVVDEWRCRSQNLLNNLSKDSYQSSSTVFDDACSSNSDPIRVCAEPLEHSSFSNLIDSENVGVAKFITVISYDCNEIFRFTGYARRNICRQLVLFGHGSSPQEMLLEGEPQKVFGHSLSLFMELFEITRQMSAVMCNLLQQLDFIYSLQDKNGTPCKSFKSVTLVSAFSSFADGLALILTLDEILAQNSRIKSYLSLFARMLNKVKVEVGNFGIAAGDLDDLDQVVNHLEKLLDLGLFQRLLQEELSWAETLQKVKRNKKFLNACTSYVNDGLSEILPRLDTWKESLLDRRSILHYLGLFLFHVYASEQIPDKRSGNIIMKTLQVIPVIYSEGGCRLVLLDILRSHFPPSLPPWPTLSNAARESVVAKNTFLVHLNDMYSRDWQSIKDALACWVASFQSTIHPMIELSKVEACLALHFKQIIQGILLANRIQMMAISILDLHALLEVPIRRERLKSLCHLVVLMKVVESTFHKKELDIIQSLPHMINLIQADIEHSLLCVKEKLLLEVSSGTQVSKMALLSSLTRGGKDRETQLTDSLSSVLISLQMLQGGGGSQRFFVLSTALDVLQSIGHVDIDYSRIKKLIYKVNIIAKFQSIVKEVTDCSFLYWRKEMIVTWFSMVYMDVNKFSWLQYLLDAFGDGLWFLKLGHVGKSTVRSFEEELEDAVKNEIIAPLCRDIETDLRLHVHSTHLKGSVQVNPRKTGVRNLSWYLQLRPLRLPYKSIDIKFHVDSYLYSAFYKYTAMSSYNWKIYLEMRQLAGLKYGLVLDETHLSDHSLESLDNGVDVPAILQNLEEFATSYMYSMTNQVFIEKTSSYQARNTLRVFCTDHVASSITAHGLGMIPSASNSVLRFLTKKILAMSDILQQNAVNSLSVKEFIFWKCEKETTNSYPLVQVEKRNVAMKLPFADHEIKFLERLCCIITEMGNVLGLMRVLQAGGSRHAHNSSRFLYKPKSTTRFAEHSQELGFINETIIAGKIVDATIENTCQAEDHLKCLASLATAFTKEFKSSENLLLRDFYLVIPPLIIYFVDSKINCKDNILRRGRDTENQITTDDGFMMGIVIILKVTEQEKSFDGLHWFENVNKRLEEELLSLEETRDTEKHRGNGGLALLKLWGQTSSPISPEVQKGIDKLKRYQKELELVQCVLNITRTLLSCN